MKKIYWIPFLLTVISIIAILFDIIFTNGNVSDKFLSISNKVILGIIAVFNLYYSFPSFRKCWLKFRNKEIISDLELMVNINIPEAKTADICSFISSFGEALKTIKVSDKISSYGLLNLSDRKISISFKSQKIKYKFNFYFDAKYMNISLDPIHGRIKDIYKKLNDIQCIMDSIEKELLIIGINRNDFSFGAKMIFEDEKMNPYLNHIFNVSKADLSNIEFMKLKTKNAEITESNITVNSATMTNLIDIIKDTLA